MKPRSAPPSRTKPSKPNRPSKRILCVRLRAWPIARWFATHAAPEAAPPVNTPLLLYEFVRSARRVSACSAAARRLGIRPGMTIAEATALAGERNTRKLVIEPHDRQADLRMLRQLAEWCEQFSPLVGWEPADQWQPGAWPDSLLLDVTGLARLFGGEGSLARRVTRAFDRRGFPNRVAVADTVGAAWGLAHCGPWRGRRAPWVARTGGPDVGTGGPGDRGTGGLEVIGALPVEALRLSCERLKLLDALGVDTVGALAALPRGQLSARFGPELLRRLDQLTGRAEEVIVSHRPPPVFALAHVLNHPTHRTDTLEAITADLLAAACRQLARRRRGALRLEVRFDALREPLARMSIGLYRASADHAHLMGLVRLQLEQVRLPDVVTDVSLEVTATGKLEVRQQSLFAGDELAGEGSANNDEDDARRVAELVDRLSSRLGEEAVLQARILRDAQPEFACRWQPLTGRAARRSVVDQETKRGKRAGGRKATARSGRGQKTSSPDAAWTRGDIPPRPLWLRRRPTPLSVSGGSSESPPARFRLDAHEHQVAVSWGPERIETGWWRGRMTRRDYYKIETTTGLRFWLFRHENGGWFLHGEFDS